MELKKIFEKQIWILLFNIFFIIIFIIISPYANILQGSLFGLGTVFWAFLSLGVVIIHHTLILFFWRLELHYSTITKKFGEKGFKIFVRIFFILFGLRVITQILLAISNYNSLSFINVILFIIGIIFIFPSGFLMYSVIKYFGLERAAGGDHFYEKYRTMPFVKKGIFKYSGNAMYVYGFLMFWIPGLLLASSCSLIIALFSHVYIWLHYYTLELPDIKKIYGGNESLGESTSNKNKK